jgi:o-succinylbenzoate synthase
VDTNDDRSGFGECAPLSEIGGGELSRARARLLQWCEGAPGTGVAEALRRLETLDEAPAARCAAETALLDILAQTCGKQLAYWLNRDAVPRIKLNTNLGSTGGNLHQRVGMALDQGFQVLKAKVGVYTPEREIQALQSVAATLPHGAVLRLDANRAWSAAQARRMLDVLAPLPVESLEEPLCDPDPETLADLQAHVPWPLALDESLPALLGKPVMQDLTVRRLVLKTMLLGGLLPAVAIARKAAESGIRCVVTTTVDSAVGTLAALHLATAIEPRLAHGLDTGRWLEADTGTGPCVAHATMTLPECAGLGFRPGPMLSAV